VSSFTTFVSRLHRHLSIDPNACVEKGIPERLGELPDPSLAHAAARTAEAVGLLQELDALRETESLDFDAALDADLAELLLKGEIHRLSHRVGGEPGLSRTPTAGKDIGDGIFLLLAHEERPAAERLADVTSRLEGVPDYVEALLGRLTVPVARWASMDLERVDGLQSLFDSACALGREVSFSDLARLEAASTRALAAVASYRSRLAALPTTPHFHVGPAMAERIVALRGIDQPLETLKRWAREFLAENAAAVEELRGRLVASEGLSPSTSAPSLQHHLSAKYRLALRAEGYASVLERYREELGRIVAFIQARDLFPIPAEQSLRVLETPAFMRPSIPAGAMMSPPPFRDGPRKSLVYLTLSDELLDEHTELSIPMMMIHEGIPGHHLQLAAASAHPSIVRKHFEAMDQAEGWTTMLEDYMLDAGYLAERADAVRFVAKREIARIGARVAIDLFFMTGDPDTLEVGVDCDLSEDDPFAKAGSLLGAVTGFVPGRVRAELGWYSQERGYPLCYLTGNRLVWELRSEVSRHLGAGLDTDRRFHRAFLDAGSMPVSMLRRVMSRQGLLGPTREG
jgi:hypothetical protein